MLWVYDHFTYFNSFSAKTVFIRQNLTYKDDLRTKRVNIVGRNSDSVLDIFSFHSTTLSGQFIDLSVAKDFHFCHSNVG